MVGPFLEMYLMSLNHTLKMAEMLKFMFMYFIRTFLKDKNK